MSTHTRTAEQHRWVKDGALGAGRLRFGADYNPEQWPRDVWHEDMRLMKKAGVNVVSLGIFSWALLEPRPGEWDFGWLDDIVELLHENGIDIDLATATASPPPWLSRLHPEVLPVTDEGTVLHPGGRQHWRPTSPVFRTYALRLVRAIAERYGDHPAVVAWHISNELGCHNVYDHSEDAARAFRDWLRDRYDSLDALNDAWGTAFWSQHYTDWEDIVPPRVAPTHVNPGRQLDFERFSSDALRDYLRAENAVLAEVAPSVPRTTNFMVTEVFPSVDYATWVDDVDFVSNDHYLRPGAGGREELSFSANLTGGLAQGRPWFLMEHATSAVNWRDVNTVKRPGELERDALTHVGHGADAVCFFQWRQSRAGGERYHSAMVPHAGEDSRVYRDVAELGATLARLAPVTGSHRVPARVAILFDWESWWVAERDSHPSNLLRYRDEALDWYTALLDLGVRADIVPVGSSFDGYEVVIAPMLHVVPDELRGRLEAYVAAGGELIATYFSGTVDEHDRVWLGGYPGALRDLLGIVVEEFAPLLPGEPVALTNGAAASAWTERMRVADDSVAVLASYSDGDLAGSPAITRRPVAGGGATYVASDLGVEGLRMLLHTLSDSIPSLQGDVRAAGGALEIIVRADEDTAYTFLVNRTDVPVTSPLGGDRLLHGAIARESLVTVPPRGVVVTQAALR
ncbi:beta-galactosidase [Microbacterium sp. NPDC019599]|uniref:beta-galactosidase n=1 Tax=Microbacterium sp. NPDC019599 TaxID=3154690 RepID=UPI0033FE96A6